MEWAICTPAAAKYQVVLSSDDPKYGGQGRGQKSYTCYTVPSHGKEQSVAITVPPLSVTVLRPVGDAAKKPAIKKTKQEVKAQ